MRELAIIGGGISGMSLAHYAAKKLPAVLVLERESVPGGCLRSERLEDGFWFEVGAHTLYNSYGALIGILEDRGAMGKLLPRAKVPFRLLVEDRIRSVVSQLGLLRLLLGVLRLPFLKKAGRTVREYYSAIVGERNYQRVFGPLFAAVPSQRADDFPAEMLFKSRIRRKDVLRSFTLQGGLQTAVELIAADPRIEVRAGAEVKAVSFADGRFTLTLADGTTETTRRLALAVPPSVGAGLLREAFPAVATPLARIQIRTVRSTAVALPSAAIALPLFAGLIPLDERFFSVVSRDTVADPRHRGFAFHFKPELDEETRLQRITATLGAGQAQLERLTTREVLLPSPTVGHEAITSEIDRALASLPLLMTGNYFGGLSIEDCVLRSKAEAERL